MLRVGGRKKEKKNTSSSEANTCTTNVHTKKRVGCSNKGGSCMLIARMSTSVNTDTFHCILSPFFVSSLVIASFFYALLHRQRKWVRDASLLCAPSYQTLIPPAWFKRETASKQIKQAHKAHTALQKKVAKAQLVPHALFKCLFVVLLEPTKKTRVVPCQSVY